MNVIHSPCFIVNGMKESVRQAVSLRSTFFDSFGPFRLQIVLPSSGDGCLYWLSIFPYKIDCGASSYFLVRKNFRLSRIRQGGKQVDEAILTLQQHFAGT